MIAGANGESLSILGEQDGVRSERGVVAIVAVLTDREKRMVGHGRKNMDTTSIGGQRRKEYVVWKQGGVRGGHGVAIGQANSVIGSDGMLVGARSAWVNEVLGTSRVGYSARGFA